MNTEYYGETYLKLSELYAMYQNLAQKNPQWMRLETIAQTRAGHPIFLITLTLLHNNDGQQFSAEDLLARPALWIDAGTHAAEWAGISAALYDVEQWLQALNGSLGTELQERESLWFTQHAIYIIPLICPDGYEALWGDQPYLRSTLRDPRGDLVECGMRTRDMDGDGVARWMRWKHPAGSFVEDTAQQGLMRGRRLDDSADDAYFMCMEGSFQFWDGWRWEEAPRPWTEGLDLNRNFPAHWQNFKMFGMDGGEFPLSEIESRAVVDAFAARPRIAAALTYHTFTGALLTQPYRKQTLLNQKDIRLMQAIGDQAVVGTDYRVIKIFPDFVYDEDADVVGVWSDTLTTVFGVPGYTLELWDPFKRNGLENPKPAKFFSDPDPEVLKNLILGFKDSPGAWSDWQSFEHPQLGSVELGGLDFMMTIRNPPEKELSEEIQRSHLVAERMRKVLPRAETQLVVKCLGKSHHSDDEKLLFKIRFMIENMGFLSSSALQQGENWVSCPKVSASLSLDSSQGTLVSGVKAQEYSHLAGWGEASLGLGGLSPSLGTKGHRALFEWIVEIKSPTMLNVKWSAGRAGAGSHQFELID
ncbi:MAG: hypothetical protein CMH49_04010 [Myxococcales bacterium]|nr:hypothetical protein [Myxococcales bacterium]